jgi:hypothetical protein
MHCIFQLHYSLQIPHKRQAIQSIKLNGAIRAHGIQGDSKLIVPREIYFVLFPPFLGMNNQT